MSTNDITTDTLRREAKWKCHLCAGSGFTNLGYPAAGLFYFGIFVLAMVACNVAVVIFTDTTLLFAGIMFLVMCVLYVIEVIAVSRVPVQIIPQNRLRSAFIPIVIVQYAFILMLVVMYFSTSGNLRMRGAGMSPELQPGERLMYRKQVQASELLTGRMILFRINSENTWCKQRALVVARILAVPGDKIAQQEGRYIVNGQQTRQMVGAVGHYAPAISVPDEANAMTVPEGCYFIVQDTPPKSLDSQILAWARRGDIVSTDIRHLVKNGHALKKAE